MRGTEVKTNYHIEYLEMVAKTLDFVRGLQPDRTDDENLTEVLNVHLNTCYAVIKGDRKGEWTSEDVNQYRNLLGVLRDIQNGFVSPTIGNVRDFVINKSKEA